MSPFSRFAHYFIAVARCGSWTAPQKLDTQLSKVQFYG